MNLKKLLGGALVVAAVTASSVGVANAVVSFGEGTGYIGRGDVIDHPALGKDALVTNPTVSYGSESHYIQSCVSAKADRKTGLHDKKDFKKGTSSVEYAVVSEKTAKGSGNVTGYRLSYDATAASSAPAAICNGQAWLVDPNGAYPEVTLVSSETGQLIFTTATHSGAWSFNPAASDGAGAWEPVVTP